MGRKSMQITLVHLAMQARVSSETSQIGIDGILVPMDMLDHLRIYGNAGEVVNQAKLNISLRNDDPAQHLWRAVARAQDEFVSESKHCATGLATIDDVARHTSALQFGIL